MSIGTGGGTPNPFVEGQDVTDLTRVSWYNQANESGDDSFKETLDLPIRTSENEAFVIYGIDCKPFITSGENGKIETVIGTEELEPPYSGKKTGLSEDGMFFEQELYANRASGQEEGFMLESDNVKGIAVPYGELFVYCEYDNLSSGAGSLGNVWGTSVEVSSEEMTTMLREWPH